MSSEQTVHLFSCPISSELYDNFYKKSGDETRIQINLTFRISWDREESVDLVCFLTQLTFGMEEQS